MRLVLLFALAACRGGVRRKMYFQVLIAKYILLPDELFDSNINYRRTLQISSKFKTDFTHVFTLKCGKFGNNITFVISKCICSEEI